MKKIKMVSYVLLTILSCLQIASATEKTQPHVENVSEKEQSYVLENENYDNKNNDKLYFNEYKGDEEEDKIVENGATKKVILEDNNKEKKELLKNIPNKKNITEEKLTKKELKKHPVDDERYEKLQKITRLKLASIENSFKKEKKTALIEQISKKLETINNLINENKDTLTNYTFVSCLNELQENLLEYKEKIEKNSNAPEDLEILAKKAYDCIDKLGMHVEDRKNTKKTARINDMYEDFRNLAYLNYFAKNHNYNQIIGEFQEITKGIISDLDKLKLYLTYFKCQHEIKAQTFKGKDASRTYHALINVRMLKGIIGNIDIFMELIKREYIKNTENILTNNDIHKSINYIANLTNNFIKVATDSANQVNSNEVIEKIVTLPYLTIFVKLQDTDTNYYKKVFDKFDIGLKYFKKNIDVYDNYGKDALSFIDAAKKNITNTLKFCDLAVNKSDFYKISAGFVTEICDFFEVMSNYFKENKKMYLGKYLTALETLPNVIKEDSDDIKADIVNSKNNIMDEIDTLEKSIKKQQNKTDAKKNTFINDINRLKADLDSLIQDMLKSNNYEKTVLTRYKVANKTNLFQKKMNKFLGADQIDKYIYFDNMFPYINSYSKIVTEDSKKEVIKSLENIINSVNTISNNFDKLPKKYCNENLKQELKYFKSSLNDINRKVQSAAIKYAQYYEALNLLVCYISNFIKKAIEPLEAEQNLGYCVKILNKTDNLKYLFCKLFEKLPVENK